MIVTAHLGDCILIAADKRAMTCNIETGQLQLAHDQEQKIKQWTLGAVVGTGETVFLDRVADYFINYKVGHGNLQQMDAIQEELKKRIFEGIPKGLLLHNTLIFTMFDGTKTRLYSIPTAPFFDIFQKDGIEMIRPRMYESKKNDVGVTCFNVPPDMNSLQNFQQKMKPLQAFKEELDFIQYHIEQLKPIFATHASIDPSITTAFDLYIQDSRTGESIALHIPNHVLPSNIPKNLNYWNRE